MDDKKYLKKCTYHRTAHVKACNCSESTKPIAGYVDIRDYSKLYTEAFMAVDSGFRLDDECHNKFDREKFDKNILYIEELYKYISENMGRRALEKAQEIVKCEVGEYLKVVNEDNELFKWIPYQEFEIKVLSNIIKR